MTSTRQETNKLTRSCLENQKLPLSTLIMRRLFLSGSSLCLRSMIQTLSALDRSRPQVFPGKEIQVDGPLLSISRIEDLGDEVDFGNSRIAININY